MERFSLDLYELHAQPSVKDTGDYGDAQDTISEDSSACYEAYFDSADAWATDGIMGLLEKFTNAGIGFAGIHSKHTRWRSQMIYSPPSKSESKTNSLDLFIALPALMPGFIPEFSSYAQKLGWEVNLIPYWVEVY